MTCIITLIDQCHEGPAGAVEIYPETLDKILTEVDRLNERESLLCALEGAGVDNWEGFDHAHEILEEWNNE